MRRNNIVAEYDYYTLDQAREIILNENRQKRKKTIEEFLSIALIIIIPMMFMIDWLIFGY